MYLRPCIVHLCEHYKALGRYCTVMSVVAVEDNYGVWGMFYCDTGFKTNTINSYC